MATRPYTGPSAGPAFPILGVLGLLFVGLKLGEVGVVKDWSWWWVLAPFWAPVAVFLTLVVFGGLAIALSKGLEAGIYAWDKRKKAKARKKVKNVHTSGTKG